MKPTLPHWLMLGGSALGVILVWLASQLHAGQIVLPDWAGAAVTGLLALGTALGWWSGTAFPAQQARMTARRAAKRVIPPVAVLSLVTLFGCSWWSGGGSGQTAKSVGDVASCVISQVMTTESTDPAAIAAACEGAAVADVLAIVASLLNAYGSAMPAAKQDQLRTIRAKK